MTSTIAVNGSAVASPSHTDWLALARELGPGFAARAAAYDANDSFPEENYRELKEHRFFSAGIPAELGGGGASHRELCAILHELGRHCGATALALSMHTHLVGTTVWLWRQGAPVAPLLERIAAEQLVLVTNGASDWLDSSGAAERVDGGYRVTARKTFSSGSPMGDLLLTSALYDDPKDGPTVLHFAVPLKAPGVKLLDTWRTMAMRASGSNDIMLDGLFVPDSAVSSRRAKGVWAPIFNVIAAIAAPVLTSVYLGVAEAARDLALQKVAKKRDDADVWYRVGEMENALVTGQMAVQGMIDLCADYTFVPDIATANALLYSKDDRVRVAAVRRGEGAGNSWRGRHLPQHGSGATGARHARRAIPSPAAQAATPLHRTRRPRSGSGRLRQDRGDKPSSSFTVARPAPWARTPGIRCATPRSRSTRSQRGRIHAGRASSIPTAMCDER